MANVVITNKEKENFKTGNKTENRAPLFRKINYILMGIGLIVLLVGYCCLRGGAVEDPNTFNGEIFNTRRLVVAPILIFIGLVTEIIAIMWHPRAKKTQNDTPEA